MKNIEEKLEIMQWLYEQGIKPLWQRRDDASIVEFNEQQKQLSKHGGVGCGAGILIGQAPRLKDPWYPLEQVLELLPEPSQINKASFFSLLAREEGGIFASRRYGEVTTSYPYESDLKNNPLVFGEKTDIKGRINSVSDNNNSASIDMTFIVVDQ